MTSRYLSKEPGRIGKQAKELGNSHTLLCLHPASDDRSCDQSYFNHQAPLFLTNDRDRVWLMSDAKFRHIVIVMACEFCIIDPAQ